MELILASTSKYRRELLERLGVPFRCEAPDVDESVHQTGKPAEIAENLAMLKAKAVSRKFPGAVVIGSDQVPAIGEKILNKPGDRDHALVQLHRLSGKSHSLFTAVALLTPTESLQHLDETRLYMRQLPDEYLERYLDRDEPYDCAGSYKIECAGISLFQKIESADFTAIQGLPLIAVTEMLLKVGFVIP